MSRVKSKNLTPAIRAPFWKNDPAHGYPANTANALKAADDWAFDNGYDMRWTNAAGTDVIRGMSVDSGNNLLIGEQLWPPLRRVLTFNLATTASLVTQHFIVIPSACRLVGITEIHATAESTAATLTAYVEKLSGTTVPGSGTTLMSGTFDLKATANTMQSATLTAADTGDSDSPIRQLAAGDRLGIVISATATELAGVQITITISPTGGGHWAVFNMRANGDLIDQTFFVANRDFIVLSAFEVHSTLGTNGSAVNVQLVKDTGTNAPGAGTDMLTNSTNAGFDLKGAVNTVQTGVLATTAGLTRLAAGNRLSVDFAGTLTAVAGVVVVVLLQAVDAGRKDITFTLDKVTNLVDQSFFTADRNYQIVDASAVWAVAFTTALNVQLTRDTITDAPGGGTDLLSNDSNAGFQIDGTANTVEVATWKDTRFNYLMAGDRLSLDFAGTPGTGHGLTITVGLIPA